MQDNPSTTLLDHLAGGLGGWAVSIWGDRLEAQGALARLPDSRRQLWLAVWAQMTHRLERVDSPTDFSAWRERLSNWKARDIAAAAGFGTSLGLGRCLDRLGSQAFRESRTYVDLLDELAIDSPVRKLLFHASSLDERTIGVIGALGGELRSIALINALVRDRRNTACAVRRLVWRIRRVRGRDPQTAAAIIKAIERGGNIGDDDLWGAAGFPEPPWVGTDTLCPLKNIAAVNLAGRDFRNCLIHWTGDISRGKTYFYRLGDHAIVEMEALRGIGWEMTQAFGPRNRPLDAAALRLLREALEVAPDHICREIPEHGNWRITV